MKRPLSRLRLTPRGRLRRNVVLLLLLPLALLLVLRPCFTHQAALERLPTYTLYTAQALDGQGQVLYTVERTMVDEHDII